MKSAAFLALLKRETREHRSLVWAPLITAALIVVSAIFSTTLGGGIRSGIHIDLDIEGADFFARLATDLDSQSKLFGIWMGSLMLPVLLVGLVVVVFYLLDSLYAERKDRSILFWKSMPVSDAATVLSKAVTALIALPLWVWLLSMIAGLVVFAAVALKVSGTPIAPLGNFHAATWVALQLTLLQNLLIASLWYAPIAAWLLLVSAWSKRSPILWAVLPPALLSLAEQMVFGTGYVARLLGHRLGGFFEAIGASVNVADDAPTTEVLGSIRSAYDSMTAAPLLADPGLYVGLVAAALLLLAAIRLRRWRDDS
jgi:ABC-2 type transport system permease protein